MRRLLLPMALAAAVLVDRPAAAVETEGRGENVDHVLNVPYPDLHAPEERNAGTDLELATITVAADDPAAPAPAAPAQPGRSGAGSLPAPAGSSDPAAAAAPGATPASPTVGANRARQARKRAARLRRAVRAQRRTCTAARKARPGTRKRARLNRRCKTARRTVTRLRSQRRSAFFDADPAAAGVQRTFAFAGSMGDGLQIIDVTDPASSNIAATWDCGIAQGDVQLFRRPDLDNRLFATFTADDGYDLHEDSACVKDVEAAGVAVDTAAGGTFIADVSDPYAPKTVSYVKVDQGSHNQTVHPSGKWLYNSNSDLITSLQPAVEIIDIADPANPKVASEFDLVPLPGLGTEAHDITFNADGTEAYVAALSHGEILDTTDPANPKRTGTIVDPTLNVWHQMEGIELDGRSYVIAEDEVAGALATGQCPNGGVHVYDATGPLAAAPIPVGYWNISDFGLTEDGLGICTAHVFQIDPEAGIMTIAFYNGGVRVVDLRDLVGASLGRIGTQTGMKELGSFRFKDSNTWAVKAAKMSQDGFFLFGNDYRRGFDVYRYQPGAAPAREGRWLTPAQVTNAVNAFKARGGSAQLLALCLLAIQDKNEALTQRRG